MPKTDSELILEATSQMTGDVLVIDKEHADAIERLARGAGSEATAASLSGLALLEEHLGEYEPDERVRIQEGITAARGAVAALQPIEDLSSAQVAGLLEESLRVLEERDNADGDGATLIPTRNAWVQIRFELLRGLQDAPPRQPERWVLLAGDPRAGLEAIGPFQDEGGCEAHALSWDDSNWWPLKITHPSTTL